MIKRNNKNIIKIMHGSKEVSKVYRGRKLVYQAGDSIRNYQVCEYISSTIGDDKPYLNLGFAPQNNERIEFEYEYGYSSGNYLYNYIFGAYGGASNNMYIARVYATPYYWFNAYWTGKNSDTDYNRFSSYPSTRYKVKLFYENNGYRYVSFNNQTAKTDGVKYIECEYPYYLFCENSKGSASFGSYGFTTKFYSFKLYHNDTELVMNLVPVYRKSDGEVGMFDLVTNTFFGNQGTGAFEHGSEVYDFAA